MSFSYPYNAMMQYSKGMFVVTVIHEGQIYCFTIFIAKLFSFVYRRMIED